MRGAKERGSHAKPCEHRGDEARLGAGFQNPADRVPVSRGEFLSEFPFEEAHQLHSPATRGKSHHAAQLRRRDAQDLEIIFGSRVGNLQAALWLSRKERDLEPRLRRDFDSFEGTGVKASALTRTGPSMLS